jgi:hypothetical protein
VTGVAAAVAPKTPADPGRKVEPRPSKPEKDFLNRKEAANYLTRIGYPIAPQTLAKYACNNNAGGGPSFSRQSWKSIVYARADLDDWRRRRAVRVE